MGSPPATRSGPGTPATQGRGVRLKVNGHEVSLPRSPERSLLMSLRVELDLPGTKYGCGEGECGACMVLLNGKSVRSCQVSVRDLEGAEVTTIEGLAQGGRLSSVQRAFAEIGAFQCGYCTPGMVISTTALLRKNPHPSDSEVREALEGNLCRCCGYGRILRAVERATELHQSEGGGPA